MFSSLDMNVEHEYAYKVENDQAYDLCVLILSNYVVRRYLLESNLKIDKFKSLLACIHFTHIYVLIHL